MTPRKIPRPKVAYPGSRGPGPGRPVQPPRPTTPKDNASGSLCINSPVYVDLSNADEIRATVALATLLGSVLPQRQRIEAVIAEPRRVSSLLRQFSIQFSESATSFTGWLIHATLGSAGGVGILRTNRSGCAV